ncbi:IMP2' (YIL154C) [Zygosaccharomyces parabailii]|nr:IMP2' (YIL154C) [Zygosaccharomyces parabailii]
MNQQQQSILLTLPDGTQNPLQEPTRRVASNPTEAGVQFDADELERGRSRVKATRRLSNDKSNSTSRSTSRAASRVRSEEFLKWTVLRRDPSMRLHRETHGSGDESSTDSEDSSLMEEVSDEEQVSDVENDHEIDEQMQYDMGSRVLPNYVMSISEVLDTSKRWISDNELREAHDQDGHQPPSADYTSLPGGYSRAVQLLSKGRGATTQRNYILCTDLTTEANYALAYVIGALVSSGDTLYLVHWDGKSNVGSSRERLLRNVAALRQQVLHKLDCAAAALVDLDVVILSLTHPYPKHLLSEMIYALKPITLCCSLSLVLTTLQNFVCSVPTLVIRKKLKRSRKKGISD